MTILVIHIILEMILLVKIAKDYHEIKEIKELKDSNDFLKKQNNHLFDISMVEVGVINDIRNDLVNKLNSHRYKLAPKYTKGEQQVAEQFNALLDRLIEDIR